MIRILLRELVAKKEIAEKRKIKLDEIAEATGISKTTLSKMQSVHDYNAKTENLNRLCTYFNCKIQDLLEYIPD